MNNTSRGKLGEDLACQYLKKLNYKILERNFRIRGGEIDIIAIEDDTLVYIEVKTRSSNMFGTPEESVTPSKIKFLERAANFYKSGKSKLPTNERIDVVSVWLKREPKIKLLKSVTC